MTITFEPIAIEKQEAYIKYLAKCPQKTSDYSFVNLWGWAHEYGLCWAWEEHLVWIKQTRPLVSYWAPVGAWQMVNWSDRLAQLAAAHSRFDRIPDRLLQYWKESQKSRLQIEAARGHWDYLYAVSELVNLQGNRFHKKKNLLNQFKKKYDYTYRTLGPDLIDQALAMQTDWCTWRDCESSETLTAENRAIERVLKDWEHLSGITGGALMVNHKMTAYTVAESLTDDMLLIHFEKASPDYKGGYQAVNQMFLAHSHEGFKTVNREQDLDDEGLRNAKLSYHPIDFLHKFRVVIS
jgi:hypothetical protein